MKYFIDRMSTGRPWLYRVNDESTKAVDYWSYRHGKWAPCPTVTYNDGKIWYCNNYAESWTKEITEAEIFLELL